MTIGNRVVLAGDGCSLGLPALIDLWRASLEQHTSDLSLAPEWTMAAASSAGLIGRLRMLGIVDSRGALRAFASYVELRERQYALSVTLRELPGNRLVAYHNELPGDAVRELVAGLAKNESGTCDVLHVPSVPRGGFTDALICELAHDRGWRLTRVPGYRSPYVPIAGTWDEYLAGKSSNFRYTLNRKRRALAAHGEIVYAKYNDIESVEELLRHIEQIEASSWKVGANMAITDSGIERAYYRELLPWLAKSRALAANVVFVGTRPAAYSLCYHWGGRVAQLKTSFDEQFSAASPGLVVNAEAIKDAFDLGAHEFDFLGDVMPHKTNWTSQLREHDHLFIYTLTLKGRVLGFAKHIAQRLRPKSAPSTVGRSGRRPHASTHGS